MLQPEDNAEQFTDKAGRDDTCGLLLWDQTPISQGCVLQTAKLCTPEIKLLEEIEMLGKQVMTVDELLVCLFLTSTSSDQS